MCVDPAVEEANVLRKVIDTFVSGHEDVYPTEGKIALMNVDELLPLVIRLLEAVQREA